MPICTFTSAFKDQLLQSIIEDSFNKSIVDNKREIQYVLTKIKQNHSQHIRSFEAFWVVCNGRTIRSELYGVFGYSTPVTDVDLTDEEDAELAPLLQRETNLRNEATEATDFVRRALSMSRTIEDLFLLLPTGLHKLLFYLKNHPTYMENDPDSLSSEDVAEFKEENADAALMLGDHLLKRLMFK